ncbi:alpha-mannosidase [Victivallaceae bacterium BBE-744-WT-12]|uniref:Alpha-mannosidase n=1 Tax=Victivallis lenta TaxID=2606640 RepID=A0A844G465_9BACT|nr:glycoside hydrolase family 38 C-terminal domain-containing protein [Victivallis lenta]MST97712.1 alpha-mannosidase [Victivallis lenta]
MRQEQIKILAERCRLFLQRTEPDLLQAEFPCRAEFAVSDRMVPWRERLSLPYRPISEGEFWGQAWQSAWFHLQAELPEKWADQPVALRLNLSGENLLFDADGVPVAGLTAYSVLNPEYTKEYFPLPDAFRRNGTFDLWLEAAASSNFGVYLAEDPHRLTTETRGCFAARVERMRLGLFRRELWHLRIEFSILWEYYQALPEHDYRRRRVLAALSGAIDRYADDPDGAAGARQELAPVLALPALHSAPIACGVGHAHIDTGWLWPVSETIRKSARTFANQLDMMDKYPEYTFGASQPQHYAFVKQYYPELFEKIRRRVSEGRWELQGGMWVEADCNLISGESMIRQFLHGKNFFRDEFGMEVHNLWLPDVFGYSPALPQIMKKSGCDFLLTQKISWNQFNTFPFTTFFWKGIDGSEVLTHFPPENTYNASVTPLELIPAQNRFQESELLPEFLSLYGIGDGGGGPKETHIERARLLQNFEGTPRFRFGRADEFFERLAGTEAVTRRQLPVWSGELYLELHRGTLTSQAQIKRDNRKLEQLLAATEFLCAIGPLSDYPSSALDAAWKKLLINQFHDILPGSSITQVYENARREHAELFATCHHLIDQAAGKISVEAPDTLSLLNTLSCTFHHAVELPPEWQNCEIIDEQGRPVSVQGTRATAIVPPSGFTIWHKRGSVSAAPLVAVDEGLVLANDLVRYEFTPAGELLSAVDLETGLETLRPGECGNVLRLYVDRPNAYEAWDIDLFYDHEKVVAPELTARPRRESGPVESTLQFAWAIGEHSTIRQTIRLERHTKRLDFETAVDWAETRKMLRVNFPVAIATDSAACDIQYGYFRRPTQENDSWDLAKFEVSFHRYVDLSEPGRGVALLSDCKYGCRVNRGNLDLALLRSPKYPDWEADRGHREFTYSYLPHRGELVEAPVMAEAAQLNRPPLLFPGRRFTVRPPFCVTAGRVALEVLKRAEKSDHRVIRLVEISGGSGKARLTTELPGVRLVECDLLEWHTGRSFRFENGELELLFRPFEIRTFLVIQDRIS